MSDHRLELSVQGGVNQAVRWTITCECGWQATARDEMEAHGHGADHRIAAAVCRVVCSCCADVIPVDMVKQVGPDLLCLECYENVIEPVPDSAALVEDLRVLEQELRPADWDGT